MSKFDYTVFIGRFQPFHAGHYAVVQKALEVSDKLVIVVGSINQPRTVRNPLKFGERKAIIEAALTPEENDRVEIVGVTDFQYNLDAWVAQVQGAVFAAQQREWRAGPTTTALVGYKKDHSSFYLNIFPQWDSVEVDVQTDKAGQMYNATTIRNDVMKFGNVISGAINDQHYQLTRDSLFHAITEGELREESDFLFKHSQMWRFAPFPPTFNTTDAVVIQGGHILLVQRKNAPGKNLWALPGGYLGINETMVDSMIRELREETMLKVPEPVLRGSIVTHKTYDNPYRSERGRIITEAFLIRLNDVGKLPKVKGSDDAARAEWVPLARFKKMESVMFEDHFSIITDLAKL